MMSEATIAQHLRGRENNFDFLRFVAASLVIYTHAFTLVGGDAGTEYLASLTRGQVTFGRVAVAVFFVISGFLIAMSYENSLSNREFLLKRSLRIFPGLAMVLVVTTFILGPLVTADTLATYFSKPGPYVYLKNLFLYDVEQSLPGVFIDNPYPITVNGSLWTLWYEFVCYLLVMLLGALGLLRWQVMALVIAASFFIRLDLSDVPLLWRLNDLFSLIRWHEDYLELLPYFTSGTLIYLLRDRIPITMAAAVPALLMLVIGVASGYFVQSFTLAGAYLVIYLAFAGWLRLGHFAKHGDYSYGIYIYAYPIQQCVTHWLYPDIAWWSNAIVSYPIIVLCAMASWHRVEKPALAMKKKLHTLFIRG